MEMKYVRNPDGSFVCVDVATDTAVELVDLAQLRKEGGTMAQDKDGNWQLVSDVRQWEKDRDATAHKEFIDAQVKKRGFINQKGQEFVVDMPMTPDEKAEQIADAKQKVRRAKAYEELVMQTLVTERVDPTMREIRVTDEQFVAMYAEYQTESAKWKTRDDELAYEDEGYFVPLAAYHHKILKVNPNTGKPIRPVFKGEVGMMGSRVVVLEQGYGSGSTVSVAKDVGK